MSTHLLAAGPVSGHVFRVDRKRGPAWYAKYRLPDGRQVQRRLGPAWTTRGRPAEGYFTKRSADAWLHDVLEQARAGTLPGLRRSDATVADAAAEWLRYVVEDRAIKPSTHVHRAERQRPRSAVEWGCERLLSRARPAASARNVRAGRSVASTRRARNGRFSIAIAFRP